MPSSCHSLIFCTGLGCQPCTDVGSVFHAGINTAGKGKKIKRKVLADPSVKNCGNKVRESTEVTDV